MTTKQQIIESLKTSTFWNDIHQNFDATSNEAKLFLEKAGATLDYTLSKEELEIKALTGFTSRFEKLRKFKHVEFHELKESLSEFDPVLKDLYVLDVIKLEQYNLEQQRKQEEHNAWVEQQFKANTLAKETKRNETLAKLNGKTFESIIAENKNWKYLLESEFLPAVLNTSYQLENKWGKKTINPEVAISGNAKTGYKFGTTDIDMNKLILDYVK